MVSNINDPYAELGDLNLSHYVCQVFISRSSVCFPQCECVCVCGRAVIEQRGASSAPTPGPYAALQEVLSCAPAPSFHPGSENAALYRAHRALGFTSN